MITKISSILILFLLVSVSDFAVAQQSGSITGMVLDSSTGEALLGANVRIEGTNRGDASRADGMFTIRNVPAGDHTIIASYLGYDSRSMEVTVQAGSELRITFELTWSGVTGDDLVITAQARGQMSAINEQLSSRQIKNIVSSERIRELPDASAATALSRLPGVSLQDGDKVVIRGMQAKLNTVTVNGIQLPSTDMNDRSTNLGFISSNMLDGVEVTKAVTPDMDANSIGGAVNLRLREAPASFHADGLIQGSYNTQDRTYPGQNYQVWGSVSNRFLNDRLGVFLQGNARRSDGGGEIASANFGAMGTGGTLGYGQATYGMNEFQFIDEIHIVEEYGGSLIVDFRIPNGKLMLQNTIAYTNSDLARHRDLFFFNTTQRQYRLSRDVHDKQLLINALQAEHFFGDLRVDYGISHAMSNKITDLRYGDPGENFGFANGNPESPPFPSFNEAGRLALTADDIYNLALYPNDWENATIFQFAGTRDEEFEQRAYTGSLNFTLPVTISNLLKTEFRTGGKISLNNRDNDTERTYVRVVEPGNNACAADWMESQGINPNQQLAFRDFRKYSYPRGEHFLSGKRNMDFVTDTSLMDQYIRLASPCWPNHEADSKREDFSGKETITAGYLMGDFDIGTRLSVMAGFRYEHFHMDYNSNFVFQTHGVDGSAIIANEAEPTDDITARRREVADSLTSVSRSFGHFFPNLQARFAFTDWLDMRFAYTKTVSRPDYISLVPNIFRASSSNGTGGNPYLNPTIAQSYDLHVSVHANKIGLLTGGVFYKKLDDVFFGVTRLYSALPEGVNFPDRDVFTFFGFTPLNQSASISTYMNNPNPAYVHGYELDWQTNFWYLPRPFNSVVLNVNYTRIFSEMDYQQIRIREERGLDENNRPFVRFVETDTVRTARLLHQGDHIINVALGADYRGFSGRFSFRLQGDVITSVGSRPENDTYAENVYGWDFSMRQQLPIEGLSLTLSGINITHAPTESYRYFRRSTDDTPANQLSDVRYNARRFELGVRYSF